MHNSWRAILTVTAQLQDAHGRGDTTMQSHTCERSRRSTSLLLLLSFPRMALGAKAAKVSCCCWLKGGRPPRTPAFLPRLTITDSNIVWKRLSNTLIQQRHFAPVGTASAKLHLRNCNSSGLCRECMMSAMLVDVNHHSQGQQQSFNTPDDPHRSSGTLASSHVAETRASRKASQLRLNAMRTCVG